TAEPPSEPHASPGPMPGRRTNGSCVTRGRSASARYWARGLAGDPAPTPARCASRPVTVGRRTAPAGQAYRSRIGAMLPCPRPYGDSKLQYPRCRLGASADPEGLLTDRASPPVTGSGEQYPLPEAYGPARTPRRGSGSGSTVVVRRPDGGPPEGSDAPADASTDTAPIRRPRRRRTRLLWRSVA